MKLAACLLLFLLSGCADKSEWTELQENYAAWRSQEPPQSWSSSPWVFVAADPKGKPIQSVTVQFSSEPANSCISGDWKKLTLLQQAPPAQPHNETAPEPAYMLEGSALTINFTANFCDSYTEMQGQITPIGYSGRYLFLGYKRIRFLGVAYGAPVRRSGT
jgi:hypothetical protein